MNLLSGKELKKLAIVGLFLFLFVGQFAASDKVSAQNFEIKKSVLGEQTTIFIDPVYDSKKRSQISVTLRRSGSYANYYVEDDYWNKLDASNQDDRLSLLNNISDEFDQKIYPQLHDVYGSEWSPGIDDDPKINIVFTQIIQEAGGYFNPNDEYPKSQIVDGRSNEREIIYLNVSHLGDSRLKSFLAHEFQHMINWYQKTKTYGVEEEVWLNEALSEYASTASGFDLNYPGSNLESRVNIFLRDSDDSLTEWNNLSADYGAVNLFIQYLADHYGAGIIKHIITGQKTGISAIDEAIKKAGYNETFASVFNNWTIANLLNNSYIANNDNYSYKNSNLSYINFHITPSVAYEFKTSDNKFSGDFTAKNWASHWYAFSSSKELALYSGIDSLKIEFSSFSQSAKFSVPYAVYYSNGQASVGFMDMGSDKKSGIIVKNFGKDAVKVVIMPINQYKNSDFNSNDPEVSFFVNASIITSDAPIISNVTPSRGNIAGGVLLTIKGENFNQDSKIYFDDKEMADSRVIDANTIEITAPSHDQGQVAVKILNANSKDYTLANAYTYFSFADGSLIKTANDNRVYIVSGKYKRWIQSPEIFTFYRHFDWSKLIIVSDEERDAYRTAALVRADTDYKVYEINGDNTKHWLNISAEEFNVSGRRWDMVQIINEKERDFYATGADVR